MAEEKTQIEMAADEMIEMAADEIVAYAHAAMAARRDTQIVCILSRLDKVESRAKVFEDCVCNDCVRFNSDAILNIHARLDVVESTVATLRGGLSATQEHLGKVATQIAMQDKRIDDTEEHLAECIAHANRHIEWSKSENKWAIEHFTLIDTHIGQFDRQCSTLLGRLRWLLTGKVSS